MQYSCVQAKLKSSPQAERKALARANSKENSRAGNIAACSSLAGRLQPPQGIVALGSSAESDGEDAASQASQELLPLGDRLRQLWSLRDREEGADAPPPALSPLLPAGLKRVRLSFDPV